MNLKPFGFFFLYAAFIPLPLSYSNENIQDSVSCYRGLDISQSNAITIEDFKMKLQRVTEDLEAIAPERIVRFFNSLKISINPLDCAADYYSEQYEILASEFQNLMQGNNVDCTMFFADILEALNRDRKNCYNSELGDQARFTNLNIFHCGLLAAIMILQENINGATLEDLYAVVEEMFNRCHTDNQLAQ